MRSSFQNTFRIWVVVTFLVLASLLAIYLRNGMVGLNLFIQEWPLSNLAVTLASTSLTWILAGALLYLLANEKINKGNLWLTAGFLLVMFVYLQILRERLRYGDYHYYLEAATALANGQPLPDTYLYLPLWGTLLRFLVPLGDQGVMIALWTVNVIALGSFYLLLVSVLQRYNFSQHLSIVVAILFLLINTPLMRTLGFIQVNLMTIDLILLCILVYPKNNFLSALALAFAVHLKTSPAVIVLAFLLEFNWRWIFWFAISFLAIGLFPVAMHGVDIYLQFVNNTIGLAQIPDTNFHDTSFDSFLRFLNPFFGIQIETTRLMALGAKVLLLLAALYTMAQNIFAQSFSKENRLLNAAPALFVFMTLASPIVWDHHGIFTTLAFLLMLKRIQSPSHWMIFLAAYFFEFMLPSFDFFPWSYGRLIAPIVILWLMYATRKNDEPSPFIASANQWLAKLAS
ncbi:MAG TPA: glycosyltransferase family 87 protein [Anaerolineales bacterium]|nr:glycosyltransferase family 87 protein [Anaerolineales bacterium]